MSTPLRVIAHRTIANDDSVLYELDNLIGELSEFGGNLRDERHQFWWILNDLLDDTVALRAYLVKRLQE